MASDRCACGGRIRFDEELPMWAPVTGRCDDCDQTYGVEDLQLIAIDRGDGHLPHSEAP